MLFGGDLESAEAQETPSTAAAVEVKEQPTGLMEFPVQVSIIDERGKRRAAPSHEVSISGYSAGVPAAPMMGRPAQSPTRLFEEIFKTNERGVIRLPLNPQLIPAFIRLEASYLGTRFRSNDTPTDAGAAVLELYTPTHEHSELKADVVATLSVEEKYLQTETYIRVSTKGLKAVDLGSKGLSIGFLGLRMGADVLDYMITEDKFDHMKVELNRGSVSLVRGPDGIGLKGIISPSAPALLRVAYPIPHWTQQTQIAAKWSTTLNSLKLDLRSPERYVAELFPGQKGDREVFYETGLVREHYLLSGSVPAGQRVLFNISSLPVQNPAWRQAILWLCTFVAVFMALLWIYLGRVDSRGKSEEV